MTDKLICPFCGSTLDIVELKYTKNCGCPKCRIVGCERLWKQIAVLQKKLDMAMELLTYIEGEFFLSDFDRDYIGEHVAEIEEIEDIKE